MTIHVVTAYTFDKSGESHQPVIHLFNSRKALLDGLHTIFNQYELDINNISKFLKTKFISITSLDNENDYLHYHKCKFDENGHTEIYEGSYCNRADEIKEAYGIKLDDESENKVPEGVSEEFEKWKEFCDVVESHDREKKKEMKEKVLAKLQTIGFRKFEINLERERIVFPIRTKKELTALKGLWKDGKALSKSGTGSNIYVIDLKDL